MDIPDFDIPGLPVGDQSEFNDNQRRIVKINCDISGVKPDTWQVVAAVSVISSLDAGFGFRRNLPGNSGNHILGGWANVVAFCIMVREKRYGNMDKKSMMEFLRKKLGKESTKNGAKNLFWRVYSVLEEEPLWRKLLDVGVGWIIWYVLVTIFYAVTGMAELDNIPMNPGARHIIYLMKSGYLMLGFHPVTVFWLHCTYIVSDEMEQEARAIEKGKSSFKYRENKFHFHGYAILLVLFVIWAVMLLFMDELMPRIVRYMIVSIPILINFIPELTFVYTKLKRLTNGQALMKKNK